MIEGFKKIIEEYPHEPNKLYLLKNIDEETGFFFMNDHLLFVVADSTGITEIIETEQLLLQTNVRIEGVENSSSFLPGQYSYIQFDGKLNDDNVDLSTFTQICELYCRERGTMSFREFFFSIIDLFQLPQDQGFKNLIGLYGELIIMRDVYEKTSVDISCMWHKKSSDKYDFSDGNRVLEVKTTLSDKLEIKVKHQQLFGREGIILAVVQLEKANAGLSLFQLVEEMEKIPVFHNGFQYHLILEKELRRVSKKEAQEDMFNCAKVNYYRNTELITFEDIPGNISDLSYSYYLGDTPCLDIMMIFQ